MVREPHISASPAADKAVEAVTCTNAAYSEKREDSGYVHGTLMFVAVPVTTTCNPKPFIFCEIYIEYGHTK